jgi:hypothetical protein
MLQTGPYQCCVDARKPSNEGQLRCRLKRATLLTLKSGAPSVRRVLRPI